MRARVTLPSTRTTMSSVKPIIIVWSVASSMPRLAACRRRLGGGHLPLELAHRLLDQLEGFLDRALQDEGAQVGIGLLLHLARTVARIDGRVGLARGLASATKRGGAPDRWSRR